MSEDDYRVSEINEALETTDQMHDDVSRLKRRGVLTSQEGRAANGHIDEIVDTLTEKLPEVRESDATV